LHDEDKGRGAKMQIERRQFSRVTVLCKVIVSYGERLLMFDTHTENLGVGGMRIIIGEGLIVNAELEVELFLPDRGKMLKCKGRVAWSKEMAPRGINPRFFDTGIEFTKIEESDREMLQGTINALMTQVQRNAL
jgi:Tfp pilus assembly protein PilZ